MANLDRDRDGIACEDNPAPFDRTPVKLTSVSTASAARTAPTTTQGAPAPPVTGDGSSHSRLPVNWTVLGLLVGLLLGLVAASGVAIRRSAVGIRVRHQD